MNPPRFAALWTWPNALSLLRIPLAVAFLAFDQTAARVAILAAAGASDFVDGWIARRFQQESELGEILDPVTDKLFVLTALTAFLLDGFLAPWQLAVLLARDIFVAIGFFAFTAMRVPFRFRARIGGKLVTVCQIAALLTLTIVPDLAPPLVLLTGVVAIYAIVDYGRAGGAALRRAVRFR